MTKGCLAILLKALALAVGAALVVGALGLFLRWSTARQFSDGLFWGAGVLGVIGFAMILGGTQVRSNPGLLYSDSAGQDSIAKRTSRWVAGVSEDFGVVLTVFLAAVIVMGISAVIGTL